MTNLRSKVASGKALAKIGRSIGLGEQLKLGKGERQSGGHQRASNIADAMESILGAAFLDGGMKAVGKIFKKLFVSLIDADTDVSWSDNPKGELQQITQTKWKTNPSYLVVTQHGPSHSQVFTIKVTINGKTVGTGKASNKRDAEQKAAQSAIQLLRKRGDI